MCLDNGVQYNLIAREQQLRCQLDALRERIVVQTEKETGNVLRSGAELATITGAALQELNAMNQAYESVIAQLRMATTSLAGVSTPPPFSLAQFRQAVNKELGQDWIALDYFLNDAVLFMAIVDSQQVRFEKKELSDFDRAILAKCLSE